MRLNFANYEKRLPYFLILVFIMLAVYNLFYPGISIDEATDGIVAKNIFRNPPSYFSKDFFFPAILFLTFSNKIFPIMQDTYLGAVVSYLILPFSLIFGWNVFSLRLTSICISALSILLIYFFCKLWFGRNAALLTTLLISINLLFVQYSRVGLYREEIFIIFFFWAGLLFLAKYSQMKKNIFLYLSFYFWGVGFSTKITFLWYAIGIILAFTFLGRKINLLASLNIKKSVIALFSFCLGALFIIIYNIKHPWGTVKLLLHSLLYAPAGKKDAMINNLAYLTNLKIRISDLILFLNETIPERVDWGIAEVSSVEFIASLICILTIISITLVLIMVLSSHNLQEIIRYRMLFLYAIYLTVFFLSPFTVSGFSPGHLMVLFPFPQIILAFLLNCIWQRIRQNRLIAIAICSSFLIPYLLFNVWMNIYFNSEMEKSGGSKRWSTSIYELADYLQKNKITSPIMFGWGLRENLFFLTDGKVMPVIYDENFQGSISEKYDCLLTKEKTYFYLTMNSEENLAYRNKFMLLARERGKEKILEKVFYNQQGKPVYWLFKIS